MARLVTDRKGSNEAPSADKTLTSTPSDLNSLWVLSKVHIYEIAV